MTSPDRYIEEDVELSEKLLRRMCCGARIGGMRFGPILQILLDDESNDFVGKGQLYVNVDSLWSVFAEKPNEIIKGSQDLVELPVEEQIESIVEVRERTIVDIELCRPYPHLVITLDNGRVVFINGKNDLYETWIVGVAFADEPIQVIACPGGGIAIFAPDPILANI